jgi:hypothetical protein
MGQFQPSSVKSTQSQRYRVVLGGLSVDDHDLDHTAQQMIGRFDEAAAWIAHELAVIADALSDMPSAEKWRDITGAIEQLQQQP